MRPPCRYLPAILLSALWSALAGSASGMIDFDRLEGEVLTADTRSTAVSPNGKVIVGQAISTLDAGSNDQAIRLVRPTKKLENAAPEYLQGLDVQHFQQAEPHDLSASGRVIVGSLTGSEAGQSRSHAFFWTEQTGVRTLSDYGTFEALESSAAAVSRDGSVAAGWGRRASDEKDCAFIWSPTTGANWIGASASNSPSDFASRATAISSDGRVVVGTAESSGNGRSQFFIWSQGAGLEMPLGSTSINTQGSAVSADGEFVVGSWNLTTDAHLSGGFRWSAKNGFEDLGNLAQGEKVSPIEITDDGRTIAGNLISTAHQNDAPAVSGFLWNEQRGLQRLDDVLRNDFGFGSRIAGWDLGEIVDISSDGGTIIGRGVDPSGQQQDWRAILTVPELRSDANFDGRVNLTDWARFRINFGFGKFRSEGDFDSDGDSDIEDLKIIRQEFGKSHPFTLLDDANPVPEPGFLPALPVAAFFLLRAFQFRPRYRH